MARKLRVEYPGTIYHVLNRDGVIPSIVTYCASSLLGNDLVPTITRINDACFQMYSHNSRTDPFIFTTVQNTAANFIQQAGFRSCLKGIFLNVQLDRQAPT